LAKLEPQANDAARGLFEKAIDLDPMFATAHVGLSLAYQRAGAQHLTMPRDQAVKLASVHARDAVQLDPGDADALAELAWTMFLEGDMDNALATARQALSINPSCAQAHRNMGSVLIFTGRWEDGRKALGIFEHLSPRDANITTAQRQIANSYYFERNYERCVEAARRQLGAHPNLPLTYRWLAAALGQLGRTGEARAALEKSIAISPHELDVYVRNRVPWMRPEDYEHMLDGLRKAGWQG
jgi:adenylate cyclase